MSEIKGIIKYVGKGTALALALCGGITIASNCALYKTTPPNSIQPVVPIETTIQQPITDYSKMTWQEAIKSVQTPVQAQDYLNQNYGYDSDEKRDIDRSIWIPGLIFTGSSKGETFKYNHQRRKGVCLDFATSAAALLSDNNYSPLLLNMYGDPGTHTVFLYRVGDKYGAVGNTPLSPIYDTIEQLVTKGMNQTYNFSFTKFDIVNLNDNYDKPEEWISGNVDLGLNLHDPLFSL